MALSDLNDWLAEVSAPDYVWFVKRLAANDTLATESHQVGVYISKQHAFAVFPSIDSAEKYNPDHYLTVRIDSHGEEKDVRVVWYNNKLHGHGTRDECRITRWGGIKSPIQNPESTGSLVVFVFPIGHEEKQRFSRAWVCSSIPEEEIIEAETGVVEPGRGFLHYPGKAFVKPQMDMRVAESAAEYLQILLPIDNLCWFSTIDIPSCWLDQFPTGAQIIDKVLDIYPSTDDVDKRLIKRRDCEYQVFRSVEEVYFAPRIQQGFLSIQEFIDVAHSILQSRKSRAGKSLELHMRAILCEEGFIEDRDFSWNKVSENNKRPDFIFPSADSYKDASFPDKNLNMLAVKTTCKDRWRQILNEADRIGKKYLLTMQEGVSVSQFSEMKEAGVILVVPESLRSRYPKEIRAEILSVVQFISTVRNPYVSADIHNQTH